MLLNFSLSNYKSFKDEVVFSMEPAPKQKGLDYSILQKKIGKKTYKALSSAVIYGPNASGKTNLIGAVEVLQAIMLRGNILNSSQTGSPNVAASSLDLIPNSGLKQAEPVSFGVTFIKDQWLINYQLSMDLGKFLEVDYQRKVLFEKLSVNGETVFTREEGSLKFENLSVLKEFWSVDFSDSQRLEMMKSLAQTGLNQVELFLMNGFKAIFCPKFVEKIVQWFKEQLVVICRADALRLIKPFGQEMTNGLMIEKHLSEAAKSFGIHSNVLGYIKNDNAKEPLLCSVIANGPSESVCIPAEVYESYGTVRFVNLFPLLISAMATGGTLLIDEFDASIHPMALMNIVNIFHNDEINVNKAQLIFNTHNPIFLSPTLYRRDEIKFVERDEETHFSQHYSLSDFGTSGSKGVRKSEDYLRNYCSGNYGAVQENDFSDLFSRVAKNRIID